MFNVALCLQRQYGLLGTGSPGRPPRFSHSSWAVILNQQRWLIRLRGALVRPAHFQTVSNVTRLGHFLTHRPNTEQALFSTQMFSQTFCSLSMSSLLGANFSKSLVLYSLSFFLFFFFKLLQTTRRKTPKCPVVYLAIYLRPIYV